MSDFKKAMLFEQRKKSMGVAYLLGALLGGFGAHYFYAGKPEFGVALIAMLIFGAATQSVVLLSIFYIAVFAGVIHTYYVVNDTNKKIMAEIEVLTE